MNNRSRIIIILIFIVCICGISLAAEEQAEELKIISKTINITTYVGPSPAKLTSKQGTTVVWINNISEPVEILFLDKKVVLACGSSVNFFVGKDGAYESAKIPFGGTASLCFLEKGEYNYVVKSSSTFYPVRDKTQFRATVIIN